MRTLLVFCLIASSVGLARAQTATPQTQQILAAHIEVTGAAVKGDRIEIKQGAAYLQGNVTITLGGVVIATADDATIENGDMRLGSNVRVTLPVK